MSQIEKLAEMLKEDSATVLQAMREPGLDSKTAMVSLLVNEILGIKKTLLVIADILSKKNEN